MLEVLGAQAAIAIENARLGEMTRQAEVVNVIGNVAHDIYNMLAPLEGCLLTATMLDTMFARLQRLHARCPQTEWSQELNDAFSDSAAVTAGF